MKNPIFHSRFFTPSIFLLSMLSMISACSKDEKTVPGVVTPPAKQISIAAVKDLSTAQNVKVKDSGVIRGVVISDAASKNVGSNKTLFLQEGTSMEGMMVILNSDHNFVVNDSLEIAISGQTVAKVNGAIVLQDVPNDQVKKLGTGKVVPRETSVSELYAHQTDWEGSLVRISACQLKSESGNYSPGLKINDGQSAMASYILDEAVLNGKALPGDITSVVGIVRLNGSQLQLAPRSAQDIAPLKYITDDFTTWKNTTWTSNLAMAEFALHTEFAKWYGDTKDGAIKQLVNAADASFTKAGKIYPYLPKDSLASSLLLYPADQLKLKGLKVVKITFAASAAVGDLRFLEQSVGNQEININVLPFNTGVDEAKIGLEVPIESTGEPIPGKLVTPKGFDDYYPLVSLTATPKEAGKFYTAVFFIPSTLDDLTAMGITSVNRQKWLDLPRLRIVNLSSRKTPGITDRNRDRYIPVLIDKVEMGF